MEQPLTQTLNPKTLNPNQFTCNTMVNLSFSIFSALISSDFWRYVHKTWQEARYQRLVPSLCLLVDRKNKMATPASDWLRQFWLLWNRGTEFNETWQEAKSQRPQPNLFFFGGGGDQKTKMAARPWLRPFLLLLWNCWTEFNKTRQEARSQRPVPSFCFSGWSETQDGGPGLWLAEAFSTSWLRDFPLLCNC